MYCRRCKVEMVKGTAMAPVLGNYSGNISRGATIYPVTATLVDVAKCPCCGHSVSFGPQRTTWVPAAREEAPMAKARAKRDREQQEEVEAEMDAYAKAKSLEDELRGR